MKQVLLIVLCILLVCTLTSNLVGNQPATLKMLIEKVSSVNINLTEVISIYKANLDGKLIEEVEIPEDAGLVEEAFYSVVNAFITVLNINLGVFVGVGTFFSSIEQIINLLAGYIDVAIYLLFGSEYAEGTPS